MHAPLPVEILYAVRVPTWHALFAAHGYPPGVTSATTSLDAIVTALSVSDLPLVLARALFTIAAFSTEAARTDLYAARDALSHSARWPAATSPVDLIASLLAAAAASPTLAELLVAARILRDRWFRPRASHVYAGAPGVDPAVGEPTQYAEPLRARFAAWATARDLGAVLPVSARSRAGALSFTIVHEDRVATLLAASGSAPGAPVTHRPLRSHLLVYEPAAGQLTIDTDCMEAVTPLATIAGLVFFDSPRHFLDAPVVDLWQLQEHGAAALAVPELAGKLTVRAIGGTWHSGKNHAMTPRGRDFFKALARYKIRIEGGRLDLMTLRGTRACADGGPTQGDVALRPPHLLTVSEPELAPLMREFLDYAKITNPLPRLRDFFSLQPWIDSSAGWIAAEGEEGFAELVARGLLKADPANRAVTPPDHPHAGRTATAYPLSGTRFLAWSADPTIAPFVVEERDLVAYALVFSQLAAAVAEAVGLEGPATKLDDDGVLYCGRRALGPTHVLVFLLTRPIRAAVAERLCDAAGHGHAIAVAPEGRARHPGLRQLAMPRLAGPWRPLLAGIVRALKVESLVDTTLYAPADARIVLHRATMRVWVDGLLCVALTEVHFRLLEILIGHPGQAVHTKDIAAHIAKGNETADTTRRAVDSFVAAVEKCFKGAKKKVPKDLRSLVTQPRHGRYLLAGKGFVD